MTHNNMIQNSNDKLSEINFYFVPNQPILERNMGLATPEFVQNYQKLTKSKKNRS